MEVENRSQNFGDSQISDHSNRNSAVIQNRDTHIPYVTNFCI